MVGIKKINTNNNMKKLLIVLGGLLIIGGAVMACTPAKPEKDTICHKTETGYTRIVVDWDKLSPHFNKDGTPKHEGDLLYEGEVDCPACTWCGGGGGGCTLPAPITGLTIQNAVMNDGKLELVWATSTASSVNIRYGFEDGDWDFSKDATANDGFEEITGLTNGIHYWFGIQAKNDCGVSEWSASVDPLP
jgi:hypothetical protein